VGPQRDLISFDGDLEQITGTELKFITELLWEYQTPSLI
jgi:hypothetical protein